MCFHARRRRRRGTDEPLGRGGLVAHGHVAGADAGARGRGAHPRLFDLDLRPRRRGDQEQSKGEKSHEVFLFSSSWSLRQKIFPVAVRGSSSTNSTIRGTLNAAILPRAQSVSSTAVTRFLASGFNTTSALTVSPR